MTQDNDIPRVVVIDPQKIRQAGLVRLLEDWARNDGIQIIAVSRPDELNSRINCTMVVMSIGGASVQDAEPQLWIRSILTVIPEIPLAIFSDREERDEICAAFSAGARGYITTSLDVPLAMAALTFLYRGGSYFPHKAIIDDERTEHKSSVPVVAEIMEPVSDSGHGANDHDDSGRYGHDEDLRHITRIRRRYSIRTQSRTVSRYSTGRMEQCDSNSADCPEAPARPAKPDFPNCHAHAELTPRQNEVLELLGEGKPNKVIARDLNMTEATVKVHVRQIMRKFGVANRTQAALLAFQGMTGGLRRATDPTG